MKHLSVWLNVIVAVTAIAATCSQIYCPSDTNNAELKVEQPTAPVLPKSPQISGSFAQAVLQQAEQLIETIPETP